MAELATTPATELDGVGIGELIEALNDPAKSQALMDQHGWTQDDLLARAEEISKKLSAGIANVNCV